MKIRKLFTTIFLIFMACSLTACYEEETVPVERNLKSLTPLSGSVLEQEQDVENFKFITSYDTGNYSLDRWRITDSKVINITACTKNVPEGTEVLIEHVHIDMSLKSKNPQLDGMTQDSMDDSYHGTSQDGFLISDPRYQYENKFAVEGFSKDLIDGWGFVCGDYGSTSISQERLTEKNLTGVGNVYANKMMIVYDILVKNEGEKFYHTKSVLDEFLIPVNFEDSSDNFAEEEFQEESVELESSD